MNIFFIIILLVIYVLLYHNLITNKENITMIQNPNPNPNPNSNQEFYDITIFPELSNINIKIILDELLKYIQNDSIWMEWPEYNLWKNSNRKSSWKIIPLMAFGVLSTKNKDLFSNTINELKKIPNLITAGFSKLGPQTKLNYHRGWGKLSNYVLRCHLGLIVPKNKCKILVSKDNFDQPTSNEKILGVFQEENKWIIFDDSFTHSATNDSNEDRIVLILDIKRPSYINIGTSTISYSTELNNFMNEFG